MIYAQYKNNGTDKTFYIEFANTEFPSQQTSDSYKPVNATYHLENAINKAFDAKDRPEKMNVRINDPHNHYLKIIAIAFVAYLRGLGYSSLDIFNENF